MSNNKPTNADRFVNAPFHVDGNCHDPNCPIPETELPTVDLQAFEQAALRILDNAQSDVRTELYCGV
jgi:hypothetical protein